MSAAQGTGGSDYPGPVAEFWALIASLGGAAADEEAFERLAGDLAVLGYESVWSFEDELATVLGRLRTPEFEEAVLDGARDASYAGAWTPSAVAALQCAVVVAGEVVYQRIVEDVTAVGGSWDLEAADSLEGVATRALQLLEASGVVSPPRTSARVTVGKPTVRLYMGWGIGASVGGNLFVGDGDFRDILEQRVVGLLGTARGHRVLERAGVLDFDIVLEYIRPDASPDDGRSEEGVSLRRRRSRLTVDVVRYVTRFGVLPEAPPVRPDDGDIDEISHQELVARSLEFIRIREEYLSRAPVPRDEDIVKEAEELATLVFDFLEARC